MAYTDPITVSTNQVLGASDWNTYIRDNFRAMNRVTSYTPSWTATTTNPTIGNGTITGAYIKFEQLCWVEIQITWGSTTNSGAGFYFLGLPFPSVTSLQPNYRQQIPVVYLDDGIQWYFGRNVTISSGASTAGLDVTPTTPFTFGTNDIIHLNGWYRV